MSMRPQSVDAMMQSQELAMSRNLQPTLVRGLFGVVLSLFAIGGATAHVIAFGFDAEAGVVQCTAVTRASATLSVLSADEAS